MNDLKIKYVSAADIKPYKNNARTHSQEQIERLKRSISEFGMLTPIALHKGTIVYGHARFQALQELGYKSFPTIDVSHLTEAQKKAYILADNRLALDAGWDMDLLALEMKDLDDSNFDLTLTGFGKEELYDVFLEPNFSAGSEADQGRLDQLEPKMVQCPNCGDEFDSREHGKG